MSTESKFLSPIYVNFEDDLEEKIIRPVLSWNSNVLTPFVIVKGDNSTETAAGGAHILVQVAGNSDKIFAKTAILDRKKYVPVEIQLGQVLSRDAGSFVSFFGRGAKVSDFVSDMFQHSKNLPNIHGFGKFLAIMSNDMTRRDLESFYKKHGENEAGRNWLTAMARIEAKKFADISVLDYLKKMQIPFSEIEAFADRYGRPPFPTGLLTPQGNVLLEEELETKKPVTTSLFQKDFQFLIPQPLASKEETLTLIHISPRSAINSYLFTEFKYENKQGKESYGFTLGGQRGNQSDDIDFAISNFCKKHSFETYRGYHNFYKEFVNRGIALEFFVTDGKFNLREPERHVILGCLEQLKSPTIEKTTVTIDKKEHTIILLKTEKNRYILSDNGEILVGRYVLGGINSIKESEVLTSLRKKRSLSVSAQDSKDWEER